MEGRLGVNKYIHINATEDVAATAINAHTDVFTPSMTLMRMKSVECQLLLSAYLDRGSAAVVRTAHKILIHYQLKC